MRSLLNRVILVVGFPLLLKIPTPCGLQSFYWVLSQGANKGKPWEMRETVDPRVIAVILGDLGLQ